MRIERAFTVRRHVALRGHRLSHRVQRDPQPRRLGGLPPRRDRGAERLVAGRGRRARAEVFPQGRHRRRGWRRSTSRACRPGCSAGAPTAQRSRPCPRTSAAAARPRPGRSSTASPAPGPGGAGRAAISTARTTPARSSTSCASCSPASTPRPTRRSGSTPACSGPTASTARPRATTSSTTRTGEVRRSESAYERPQPHACFIQSIQDDLVNPGGIMDLWVREARLFKYGSGTGTNFSSLRGENEPLSGGGKSSGPDELPQDRRSRRGRHQVRRHHPARRQDGRGRRRPSGHRGLRRLEGARGAEGRGAGRGLEAARPPPERDPVRLPRRRPRRRGALQRQGQSRAQARRSAPRARSSCRRTRSSRRSCSRARATPGSRSRPTPTDWDSEAYVTVAGQNSNNSVRVTGEFLERVLEDREWQLTRRTDGKVARDPARARACGTRSRAPPGPAPIPACSTTPRSTSGTPARSPAGSTPPTRARSTCSSTTRRAISPRST